jgi:glucose dehydrogenase
MVIGHINPSFDMENNYDVVIIGGGIAGSLLAYKLAKLSNLSILILEAGADRASERVEMSLAYAGSLVKTPGSPYNKNPANNIPFPDVTKLGSSDYYRYAQGSTEFKSSYLKIGGGSTWHWLGNVPRFLPNDFKLKDKYGVGFNWPISYSDLQPYYSEAEREIGVSGNSDEWRELYSEEAYFSFPMPGIWPTYSDKVIAEKLNGFEIDQKIIQVRSTPQARNSQNYQGRPACAGNSSCVPICPIQAKYDATVHLKLAKTYGVDIRYKSIVCKIERDESNLISKVHFKSWEGIEGFIRGRIVVLATHAIESAMLLQISDIGNSSGLVGKFLMDHPQGYGVGISNEPLYPFRGPPTTSGIDVFRDGEFRARYAAFRMSIGNDGWGRWKGKDKVDEILNELNPEGLDKPFYIGKELKSKLEFTGTRLFRFSYSTEMLPIESNSVCPDNTSKDPLTGMPLPKINFKVDNELGYNQKAFNYASSVLGKMFQRIGVFEYDTISDVKEFSGAGHIMGTTKMGETKTDSVVDKNCNAHDHANLFIIGAGVFTTCGTANPTLTVAALTLRLADHIIFLFDNKKVPCP